MKRLTAVFLALMLLAPLAAPACALEADFGPPEAVSLVIGGDAISGGIGFQKNLFCLTEADMETIAASASGESTYRLGLGDCFTELLTYSTFENHGIPVWGWRSVYGLDLTLLAGALGIDTAQTMSITATAGDGMVKTLPDAFGAGVSRYAFTPTGSAAAERAPVIALFETSAETEHEGGGIYPLPPALGSGSPDRVDNVFGYGQTAPDEVTACFWVKGVRRLRFGSEAVALTVTVDGKKRTAPISGIAAGGVWSASFGSVKAKGVPLTELLRAMGAAIPEGGCVKACASDGNALLISDMDGAFVAWQAADNGSAVRNATALRLYCRDGKELAGLVSLAAVGGSAFVSRGDFVQMLAEAFHIAPMAGESFSDVSEEASCFGALAAAKALGIVHGCGDGLFHPDAAVTARRPPFCCCERSRTAAVRREAKVLTVFPTRRWLRTGQRMPSAR